MKVNRLTRWDSVWLLGLVLAVCLGAAALAGEGVAGKAPAKGPAPATGAPLSAWNSFRGPASGAGIAGPALVDDLSTAKLLWKTMGMRGGSGSPAAGEGKVVIVSGICYCLDGETGKLLWQTKDYGSEEDSKHGTPAIAHGKVIALLGRRPACLDLATGKELWRTDKNIDPKQINASPVVVNGIAVFSSSESLRGYDVATGKELWSQPKAVEGWNSANCSPALWAKDGVAYILNTAGDKDDTRVVCTDAKTGNIMWTIKAGGGAPLQTPAVANDIMVKNYKAWKLSPDKAEKLWEKDLGKGTAASPVIANGCVFTQSMKTLSCLKLETGDVLWQQENGTWNGENEFSSPIAADGKVFMLTGNGGSVRMFAASPTLKLMGKQDVGCEAFSSPAIADGKLYFHLGSQYDGGVSCYDLRKK